MTAWRRRAVSIVLAVLLAAPAGAVAQADPFVEMRILIDGGYYASAAQVVGPSLVQANPDSAEAHYLYSLALYLNGNLASAGAQLERARALDGARTNPDYDWLLGLLQAAEGRYASAVRLLENAFLRSRDYRMAMDWGRVAWQQGDYAEALDAFQAAGRTERGRTELWPYLNLGRVYTYLGDFPQAITAFNEVISVFEATDTGGQGLPSPAYVEAFYRLGQVYEALNDTAKAELNYENARAADPNYLPAIRALDRIKRLPN